MAEYLIFFNQQWVPDRPDEWFAERGRLAAEAVEDMRAAGVLVFAGGLVTDRGTAATADATSGTAVVTPGPYGSSPEWIGGLTIVDVDGDEAARHWAARVAEACGWPQEVRPFGGSARP